MSQKNISSNTTKIIVSLFIIICVILIGYLMFNQRLEISNYTITNSNIPDEFNNYKIIHLSDLHYANFGNNQQEIITLIQSQKPDLILMTGDMIDRKNTNYTNTENLFAGISNIAPTYCVSGNNEKATMSIDSSMSKLYKQYHITELNNTNTSISKGSASIQLYGLEYTGSYSNSEITHLLEQRIEPVNTEHFSILLNHRSDIFNYISKYGFSLVLSGHAHGGIIRIPFIGGLIGNDGSLFPKYDAGSFKENGTVMISSRGLGKNNYIPRICNRPEVVLITLSNKL